jgi:hypothetical protein
MPHTDLQPFINAAKERGATDEFLASALTSRGWPARDVYGALIDWWERTTGLALPARRSPAENTRDAFLYLLAFSMLATWAGALGSLWFRLIEYWLPDAVTTPNFYSFRETVTWQMASILVALPIYLFVMRMLVRESAANPERIESGVRKWLTYIALLLAATGVVCDLVCFVDYFLKGEITLRFVLKCAVVLAICGGIFWYYLDFLRGRVRSGWFAAASVAGAAAALACGLLVAGTPSVQRQIQADNVRIQNLRAIASSLGAVPLLPQSLKEYAAAHPGIRTTDPETRRPYEYTRKSDTQYELCAILAAASEDTGYPYTTGFWAHPKGRACFAFDKSRPVAW